MTNYLTIKQACAALQVSRNTMLSMIQDGRVEAVDIRKPNGKYAVWRISATLVKAIIQEHEIKLLEIEKRIGL